MEDEQGDAAQGSNNGDVSVFPLPTEPFVENMGGENEVRESFEEEIMVEIVGPDVFVNGVSGEKEVCLGSGEVEDLEGHAWENREEIGSQNFSEAMDGNKMGDSEVGFLGSRGQRDYVVTDDVLNRPVEAFVEGHFGKAETEELLSSNDNGAANSIHLGDDYVTSHETANLSDGAQVNNTEGVGLVTCSPKDGIFVANFFVKKFLAAESQDSILGTDVRDENEPRHGFDDASHSRGVKSDGVLDFKDGASDINLPDSIFVSDDKCLKNGGDVETGMVHQNHVVSNYKPIEPADGGDIAEMNKDNGINIVIRADTVENRPIIEHTDPEISTQSTKCLENAEIPENISLSTKETRVCDVATSRDEVNKSNEAKENSGETNGFYIVEGHTYETKLMDVEDERESNRKHNGEKMVVDLSEPELETEEPISGTDNFKWSNEKTMKSLRMNRSCYLLHDDHFVPSDLVWGKVRSHPWWPGQIFDLADASEKAVRYYKKDSYLVAYFGDRTFAWNDKSNLKPFGSYFSEMEKQSNSEAFQNAVDSALEEVSRRAELGLACSCVPKAIYGKIEAQIVENTGIREESSRRYGVDHSSRASYFEPDKLLEYVRNLARFAFSGADLLDLVIARAQLSAFCRFKGYHTLTEFKSSGELLENDGDSEKTCDQMVGSKKRKHTSKIGSRSRKKRNSMEFVGDGEYSQDAENTGKSVPLSSGRKQKAIGSQADGSNKRVAKVSKPTSQNPTKPSFKIGECIRRAASRLTGSTSSVKGNNNDEMVIDDSLKINERSSENQSVFVSAESFSVDEMLSQLELAAKKQEKGDDFQNGIRTFFSGFRSSIAALNRRVRKKQNEPKISGYGEEFEFDDANDSYWTDRIVQNDSEEQSVKSGHKSHSRKRFSDPTAVTELDEENVKREQESLPAELMLNFAERKCVPSEIKLNKTLRRFGSLMESETEVDHDSGRARVIFKRACDAEVALNSAEKINIFGPVLVNYQIGYSPLISVKISPLAIPQFQEDETLMI